MKATKRALIGRTITDVDFQPAPRIMLDNGRVLSFVTEETGMGEYGTGICITPKGSETTHAYVLWGRHPAYASGVPIKLTGADTVRGLRREQKRREAEGFTTSILARGVTPYLAVKL